MRISFYSFQQQNASPVARDKLGRQCAHMAVLSDSLLPLKFLVEEMKVDVTSSVDYSGMTALHIAAKVMTDKNFEIPGQHFG